MKLKTDEELFDLDILAVDRQESLLEYCERNMKIITVHQQEIWKNDGSGKVEVIKESGVAAYFDQLEEVIESYFKDRRRITNFPCCEISGKLSSGEEVNFGYFTEAQRRWRKKKTTSQVCSGHLYQLRRLLECCLFAKIGWLFGIVGGVLIAVSGPVLYRVAEWLLSVVQDVGGIFAIIGAFLGGFLLLILIYRYLSFVVGIVYCIYAFRRYKREKEKNDILVNNFVEAANDLHRYIRFRTLWFKWYYRFRSKKLPAFLPKLNKKLRRYVFLFNVFYRDCP